MKRDRERTQGPERPRKLVRIGEAEAATAMRQGRASKTATTAAVAATGSLRRSPALTSAVRGAGLYRIEPQNPSASRHQQQPQQKQPQHVELDRPSQERQQGQTLSRKTMIDHTSNRPLSYASIRRVGKEARELVPKRPSSFRPPPSVRSSSGGGGGGEARRAWRAAEQASNALQAAPSASAQWSKGGNEMGHFGGFWRKVLSKELWAQVSGGSAKAEEKEPLPVSFSSIKEYQASFLPLQVEEVRASLHKDWSEAIARPNRGSPFITNRMQVASYPIRVSDST